jgi:DNA-binding transcriptional MerR regulator
MDSGYTVKQLADLAGVSVRTLHYYDEIGLLRPSAVASNGYRRYDREALERMQQILYFRELGFNLKDIQRIVGDPDFDVLKALKAHKRELNKRATRSRRLIRTIDKTILHMKGEAEMSNKELFEGFTPEQEKKYHEEARELWGAETVDASYRLWNSYGAEKKAQIMAESRDNVLALAANMDKGHDSAEVQAIVGRWAKHLEYFYKPSVATLRGLGQMYVEDERFAANYNRVHPDLPEFFRKAIEVYCDRREGKG